MHPPPNKANLPKLYNCELICEIIGFRGTQRGPSCRDPHPTKGWSGGMGWVMIFRVGSEMVSRFKCEEHFDSAIVCLLWGAVYSRGLILIWYSINIDAPSQQPKDFQPHDRADGQVPFPRLHPPREYRPPSRVPNTSSLTDHRRG